MKEKILEAVERYLALPGRSGQRAPGVVREVLRSARHFCKHYDSSRSLYENMLDYMGRGISPSTARLFVYTIGTALLSAGLLTNEEYRMLLKRAGKAVHDWGELPSDGEIAAILYAAMYSRKFKAAAAVAALTLWGLRPLQVAKIRAKDVSVHEGLLKVSVYPAKGGTPTVYGAYLDYQISFPTLRGNRVYLRPAHLISYWAAKARPDERLYGSVRAIEYILQRCSKIAVEILHPSEIKLLGKRSIVPRDFRRWVLTNIAMREGILPARYVGGHTSIQATQYYVPRTVDPETIAKYVSPRGG